MNIKTEVREVPLLNRNLVARLKAWMPFRDLRVLPDQIELALNAIADGRAATYNTATHRVVEKAAAAVAVFAMDEKCSVYFPDQPMFDYWASRNGVLLYEAPPDHAALLAEVDSLRKLLEPLAALLQRHNDKGDDDRPVFAVNEAKLTLGDLRAARTAIARSKP